VTAPMFGPVRQAVRVGDQGKPDEGGTDLCAQQRRLEKAFVHGGVSAARGPVVFSEEQLARIEHVRDHGGLLNGQEHEYPQRLKAGGRRGDPLPAALAMRDPFINGIADDFEVRISGAGDYAHVVVLFSHEHWPGVRFGHRFPPPDEADGYEHIWLKEEIETGGLARLMSQQPQSDDDGIVSTDWGWRLSQ
jgi:hypothetical protein